jgi:hypothetical protein
MSKQITQAENEAAAVLAQKMARTAGKVSPTVMVLACGMLIEMAWMCRDMNSYVAFKLAQAKPATLPTQP